MVPVHILLVAANFYLSWFTQILVPKYSIESIHSDDTLLSLDYDTNKIPSDLVGSPHINQNLTIGYSLLMFNSIIFNDGILFSLLNINPGFHFQLIPDDAKLRFRDSKLLFLKSKQSNHDKYDCESNDFKA